MKFNNLDLKTALIGIAVLGIGAYLAYSYHSATNEIDVQTKTIPSKEQIKTQDITKEAYKKATKSVQIHYDPEFDTYIESKLFMERPKGETEREPDLYVDGIPQYLNSPTYIEDLDRERMIKIYDQYYFDINSTLPPEAPEGLKADQILGWDLDKDGTRDDVERSVILKWYEPKHELIRMALLQLARDYQLAMYDYEAKDEAKIVRDNLRILQDQKCVKDVFGFTFSLEPHNFNYMYEINALESLVFDTNARVNIYTALYDRLPIDAQDKMLDETGNYCEFPIAGVPSEREVKNFRIAKNKGWELKDVDTTAKTTSPDSKEDSGNMNFSVGD